MRADVVIGPYGCLTGAGVHPSGGRIGPLV